MDGQGLQAIRGEIEAIVTFQAALNRIALLVDEDALTEWNGPRPDDVDALAGDDGTFSREELNEVRKQAGEALATRFREVQKATESRPELQAILKHAVATSTGGVVALDGPEPGGVLLALSRTGSIRLDWAQSAATYVREELAKLTTSAPTAKPAAKSKAKKKPAAAKAKAKAAKKPAAKKAGAKKAAKKPAAAKKSAAKKPAAATKKKVVKKKK